MGYDDETNRSGRHQSRARQPVKRPGGREPEYRRSKNPEYEGKKHKDRESQSRRQSAATKQDISGAYHTPNRKKMQKKRRKILIILTELIILISVLVFAAYSYLNKNMSMIQRLPWDPQDIKNIEISQEKQKQMKGYWTIAVFGVDSRNSSVGKGNNSDVNIICNINEDTGEIKLVSVFRDTYLNVSSKNTYNKLNVAYLQGGPEQAVKTLNKNLDIDIDDYATFNWKAVADAINILDGIDVTLSKAEFYYINAFVTETVKATGVPSQPVKHAGLVHLDGVQAVAYGRLRLMDTDYARTERQRKVISLAFDKAKKADWATLNNIIQTIFPQVATSVELPDVLRMGRDIGKLHLGESSGFPEARGDANMGSKGACVIPQTLENNVKELHKFLFGDSDYTPTDTVRTISKKIISDTGLAKAAKPVGHVDTNGGSVPKATVESDKKDNDKETKKETVKDEEMESSSAEWEHGTIRPGSETTKPGSDTTKPGGGTTKPGSGTTKPDSDTAKPGSGTTKPGSGTTKPGTNDKPSVPGADTDTGIILGPGNSPSTPGGGSTGNNPSAPGGGNTGNSPSTPGGGSTGNNPSAPGGGNTGNSPSTPGGGHTESSPNTPGGGQSPDSGSGNIEFTGPLGQ
ncbi:MAG: LCP family protein [Clostridium sp.]